MLKTSTTNTKQCENRMTAVWLVGKKQEKMVEESSKQYLKSCII